LQTNLRCQSKQRIVPCIEKRTGYYLVSAKNPPSTFP
jgi:hypothetical protein